LSNSAKFRVVQQGYLRWLVEGDQKGRMD
jgi:hypothetical protein